MTISLEEADRIAADAHEGQFDKQGVRYIEHPRAVASALAAFDLDTQVAALLHDVLEDTHVTSGELTDMGVSHRAVWAVKALTRPVGSGLTYMNWVRQIANVGRYDAAELIPGEVLEALGGDPEDLVPRAVVVKLADNLHNSQSSRRILDASGVGLLGRYARARKILEASLPQYVADAVRAGFQAPALG